MKKLKTNMGLVMGPHRIGHLEQTGNMNLFSDEFFFCHISFVYIHIFVVEIGKDRI